MTTSAGDRSGIKIVQVSVGEALERDWSDPSLDIDIVKVRLTTLEHQRELEAAGFLVKPTWVNWIAPLLDSESDFLERLHFKERQSIRQARCGAEAKGIKWVTLPEVTSSDLEAFLELYDRQVARMVRGVNYARRQQRQMLRNLDSLLAVYAYADDGLVGGCLGWLRPDQSMVQLRFSAFEDSARQGMLSRVVYMAVLDAARSRGFTWGSLGNDPSLFGHTAQPGLFRFKARLGFTPIPTQAIPPQVTGDEAELVVRMSTLADPSISLAYDGDKPAAGSDGLPKAIPLRAVQYSSSEESPQSSWLSSCPISVECRRIAASS
ncbi:GNAT family N-acetyltransferase [Streptomyces sp. HSG2]|uniref:GNAT family N-acetyltransferase n=1 Tax=Streptomyces sp. HSG2 TaxID=2797167 RepID=UPI0019058543|nr:GNAT family N-acetyltransferase [Streptomyces sp. HSG2]